MKFKNYLYSFSLLSIHYFSSFPLPFSLLEEQSHLISILSSEASDPYTNNIKENYLNKKFQIISSGFTHRVKYRVHEIWTPWEILYPKCFGVEKVEMICSLSKTTGIFENQAIHFIINWPSRRNLLEIHSNWSMS